MQRNERKWVRNRNDVKIVQILIIQGVLGDKFARFMASLNATITLLFRTILVYIFMLQFSARIYKIHDLRESL